ncbi:MAG: hypothetical protein ABSF43_13565 [Rectinemataceae bacterium]|jgi:hypothetical protein
MPRCRVIVACLCALALGIVRIGDIRAEDAPVAGSPPTEESGAASETKLRRDALFIELSTASFYELAARARELGLADSGGVEELRARLYKHYDLHAPAAAAKGRTVTIEKARQASYAKVEDEEGGIVRASGGVILTLVEDNGDSHRIHADGIVFNRTRSTLTARGSVYYERKSGGTTEIFSGEALSVDLDDWSGVFIDGKIRRSGAGAGSGDRGLVISADTILRRSGDVMVLKDGVISSCDADDPHYAIRAGRVWLIGDKDWAISDAVFSLGNVPILWLPFFYYPGEELAFHPVIGYRSREGYFVQTTVYLIGAKPAQQNTTSIMSYQDAGAAGPTQVKGLFLRRVAGPAPKDAGTLKTMLDLYSGLGGFAGIQGSFPKLAFLDKTDIFSGLGLSRSLFPLSTGIYTPYVEAGNWSSVWNSSYFFNSSLPFRYAFDLSTSLHSGGFTASLVLPLYSDPFFDQDFRNRSEDMDWSKLLSTSTGQDPSTIPALRTQLAPKLDTSLSFKPKGLGPWLSSIDISHLGMSMLLLSKPATLLEDPTLQAYDPRQQFFYPSVFRPIDVTASLRGTLFGQPAQTIPPAAVNAAGTAPAGSPAAAASVSPVTTPVAPVNLRSPWEVDSGDGANSEASSAETAVDATKAATAPGTDFRLPSRAPDATPDKAPSWAESANWGFTPSMFIEDRYQSDPWNSPSDVNYALLYSLYSYRLAASLDTSAAYGDFFSSSLSLTYTDQNQERPILNTDPTSAASYALADDLYKIRRVGESAKMTFKPFASSWLWSPTSLSWDMDSTIYGLQYDSSSSAFKENWLSWDPSMITAHNVSLNLAARPGGLTQSFTLTANLPPLLDSYTGILALDAGFASLRVQSRMYRPAEDADYSYDPITTNLSVGKSPGPVLSDSFVYALVGVGPVSNSTGFSWGPLSASLAENQTLSYRPVVGAGWVSYGDQSFQPTDISLGLKPQWASADSATASPSATIWSIVPNLALTQSLVRFSESTLTFGLTASVKVSDQFSLTFSSQSQNSAAWRYYPDLFGSQLASGGFSAESFRVNPVTDILDSLMIWDSDKLRTSLFKLKSLSIKAVRDLHDWTLSAEISTMPLYNAISNNYTLDTSISVVLAWKDIQNIKTTITKDSTGISY